MASLQFCRQKRRFLSVCFVCFLLAYRPANSVRRFDNVQKIVRSNTMPVHSPKPHGKSGSASRLNLDLNTMRTPGELYPWQTLRELMHDSREEIGRIFAYSFNRIREPLDSDSDAIRMPRIRSQQVTDSVTESGSATSDESQIDACLSEKTLVTPFWANNSEGETLAIVNFFPFEQAVQQELCKPGRSRCLEDCFCEQTLSWHRLLALDSGDKRRGIFMDWFQFPAYCTCRCYNKLPLPKKLQPTSLPRVRKLPSSLARTSEVILSEAVQEAPARTFMNDNDDENSASPSAWVRHPAKLRHESSEKQKADIQGEFVNNNFLLTPRFSTPPVASNSDVSNQVSEDPPLGYLEKAANQPIEDF